MTECLFVAPLLERKGAMSCQDEDEGNRGDCRNYGALERKSAFSFIAGCPAFRTFVDFALKNYVAIFTFVSGYHCSILNLCICRTPKADVGVRHMDQTAIFNLFVAWPSPPPSAEPLPMLTVFALASLLTKSGCAFFKARETALFWVEAKELFGIALSIIIPPHVTEEPTGSKLLNIDLDCSFYRPSPDRGDPVSGSVVVAHHPWLTYRTGCEKRVAKKSPIKRKCCLRFEIIVVL